MNDRLKKMAAYILVGLVIMMTVIGLLGIWEIIDLQNVGKKLIYSSLVIFMSSVVLLFIFAVLIKENKK